MMAVTQETTVWKQTDAVNAVALFARRFVQCTCMWIFQSQGSGIVVIITRVKDLVCVRALYAPPHNAKR